MWSRLKLRLEIIGYARAIGVLTREPQVPKSHINTLIKECDKLRYKLSKLKAQRKLPIHKRYMTGGIKAA